MCCRCHTVFWSMFESLLLWTLHFLSVHLSDFSRCLMVSSEGKNCLWDWVCVRLYMSLRQTDLGVSLSSQHGWKADVNGYQKKILDWTTDTQGFSEQISLEELVSLEEECLLLSFVDGWMQTKPSENNTGSFFYVGWLFSLCQTNRRQF